MKKDELLSNLQEGIRTEENANKIYFEHLHALSERINISEDIVKKIRKDLEYLVKENNRHLEILKELIDFVKGEDRDDW